MKRLIFLLGLVSHASGAFEWAGTFDVTAHSTLRWSAQAASTGAYPDADMKIIIVPGNPAFTLTGNAPGSTETVQHLGTEGFAASNEPCTVVNNGGIIPISTGDPPACFKLVFDTTLPDNLFTIETALGSADGTSTGQITKVNSIAIFAQHFPTEFERDAHYLKALDGTDIEPVNQHPSGGGGHAHGHAHASGTFEWAGTFDVSSASTFKWFAQADSTGAYPDADMKIIIVPGNPTFSLTGNAPGSTETVLALGGEGFAETNEPCTVVNNGGIIPISTGDPPACFKLVFDTSVTDNSFTIETARGSPDGTRTEQITKVNSIAIFAQHFPTEFERDTHYLKDLAGTDIEPITQQPEPSAGGHDHDHGGGAPSGPFEWAGTFDVTAHNIMTWSAQTKPDKYPFKTMKIIIVPGNPAFTLTGNAPGLNEPVMQLGTEGMSQASCTNVPQGTTIPLSTGDPPACYKLLFDSKLHTSLFSIDTTLGSPDGTRTERITKVNSIAVFGEHYPIEFERDAHYLKGVDGSDIEPVIQHPEPPPGPGKRWGAAIGASFLVMACTLIGVFFIAPFFVKLREEHEQVVNTLASAFAAGALVAAAFFLMLYEATHLIEIKEGVRTEAEASAWWGSAVLLGLVTPFIIDTFVVIVKGEISTAPPKEAAKADDPAGTASATKRVSVGDAEGSIEDVAKAPVETSGEEEATNLNMQRVLAGVLIGDFLHNLVDGFFIGAAFSNCSTSMGWTISAATIYHELAQEISDYLVLTNPKMGGLDKWTALFLNFVSGSSVIMGTCIVMSSNPSNFDTGILLAYGAGVYLQIACCECFPRVHEFATTLLLRGASFLLFCIGAIGIGLVLLDHEHCAGGDGHAHGH